MIITWLRWRESNTRSCFDDTIMAFLISKCRTWSSDSFPKKNRPPFPVYFYSLKPYELHAWTSWRHETDDVIHSLVLNLLLAKIRILEKAVVLKTTDFSIQNTTFLALNNGRAIEVQLARIGTDNDIEMVNSKKLTTRNWITTWILGQATVNDGLSHISNNVTWLGYCVFVL